MQDTTTTKPRNLMTVKQFCESYRAFTTGGIRWMLFHRQTNGLSAAVIKRSNRIYIDVDAFFDWLDKENSNSN